MCEYSAGCSAAIALGKPAVNKVKASTVLDSGNITFLRIATYHEDVGHRE